MPKKLSHYDRTGKARMVDVSDKAATKREAEASAFVAMKPEVLRALPRNPKGNPLEVARIAGISEATRANMATPAATDQNSRKLERRSPVNAMKSAPSAGASTASKGIREKVTI